MSDSSPKERPVIGWREWVSLPDFGIRYVKAKIDTGARSSALHAYDIEFFRRRGKDMVRFRVHPEQRDTQVSVQAEAPLLDERKVRSSSGSAQMRPVIETHVEVRGERVPIELTLTNRDAMGFRMLLGRQAIRGRFLVDPGSSYLGGRRKRKKKKRGKTSKKTTRTSTGARKGAGEHQESKPKRKKAPR